jgi:hypothetical protein
MVLKGVSMSGPVNLAVSPQDGPKPDHSVVATGFAIDTDDGQQHNIPEIVLGSHHLVEDHKEESLQTHC